MKNPSESTRLYTPALLLDLDEFEANLARMMEHVKSSGKSAAARQGA